MSPKKKNSGRLSTYLRKVLQFGSHISVQITVNIFGLVLLTVLSFGLLSCLGELHRLKRFTDDASLKIARITQNGYIHSDIYSESIRELAPPYLSRDMRRKRDTRKARGASRPDMNYDPFRSKTREEELEDYCMTLVYNKCTTSLPAGMPHLNEGPPGPPGPQGNKGDPGRSGHMGHMGPPGINGIKGSKGDLGTSGRIGVPGALGPRGSTGLPGVNGITGSPGRRGRKGTPGPPGKHGPGGERGFRGFKGEKGERGVSAMLTNGTNCTCRGLKGEKGQRGLIGFEGYKGEKGELGAKGSKGYGMQGFQGPQGPRGQKGERGDRGVCPAPGCNNIPTNLNYDRNPPEPHREMYSVPEVGVTLPPATPPTVPPTLFPRETVCRVRKIGKAIFIRKDTAVYGSVMMDPVNPAKIWLTRGHHGQLLEEYNSRAEFQNWETLRTYNLQYNRYYGTQHAMYNGSFYYHFIGKPYVVRYDLNLTDVAAAVKIWGSHFNDSQYVYKDSRSYYDIAADVNGLWIVYSKTKRSGTHLYVMKLDLLTLVIARVWKLPVDYGHHGNAFIACGVLYLMQSTHTNTTVIDYQYDFYTDEGRRTGIYMTIPFSRINMITFFNNVADMTGSALLAWDNGYIIEYPMLF